MKLTIPLTALVAVALLGGSVSCKKKKTDDADKTAMTAEAPPPPPPPPPPTATATASPNEVARYPDEVQIGHATVTTPRRSDFPVHQAADLSSPIITHVGHGTMVNIVATRGSWVLIEYPSGPGKLSPGWVDFDPRVRFRHGIPGRPPARPTHRPRHRD